MLRKQYHSRFYITIKNMFSLLYLCFILSFCSITCVKSEFVDVPVSEICLKCFCGMMTNCNSNGKTCEGDACGPFRFNLEYWVTAGNLTVNNHSPTSYDAFITCSKDFFCATLTIQEYMKIHKKDCNGDGKINCEDFAAIHLLGPEKCSQEWPEKNKQNFHFCTLVFAKPN